MPRKNVERVDRTYDSILSPAPFSRNRLVCACTTKIVFSENNPLLRCKNTSVGKCAKKPQRCCI